MKHLKLIVAFLIGVLVTTLVAAAMTVSLRQHTRRLEADLEWAVQRGIRVEAMLILCQQGASKALDSKPAN